MRAKLIAAAVLAPLLARGVAAQDSAERPRLVIQAGHEGIRSVAFSPDGRLVLTGSRDHTARLWDAASGKEIRRFVGHTDEISSVGFSPDGRRLLTGSTDGTARLWETGSGGEVRRFDNAGSSVAFSPNGRLVLTAVNALGPNAPTLHYQLRLWDVYSGKEVRRFEEDEGDGRSVAFSPDGGRILALWGDRTSRLWDTASGEQIRRFEGFVDGCSIAFSPDGRRVLGGSQDNIARSWDAESGEEVRIFKGHSDRVSSVAFSRDGRFVLTGSLDGTARIWDAESGEEVRKFVGHSGVVLSVAFSPDGRRVLTGSDDHTARIWDAETGGEVRRLGGRSAGVCSVVFSPDGRHVLAGSDDAWIWDAESGKPQRLKGHSDAVSSVAFSPDGRLALTGSLDKTARLWEVDSGAEIRKFARHSEPVCSVAFSADGRRVLTGSQDQTARLWDVESGDEVRKYAAGSALSSVAFSSDGRFVLAGVFGDGETARLLDAGSWNVIRGFPEKLEWNLVMSATFSPDGRRVLVGYERWAPTLWDTDTGRELRRFEAHHCGVVKSVAFSPDGRRVLTGSRDHTARLWDAESGKQILRFGGHAGSVRSVAFSPDGRRVLTGGGDGTTRVWDAGSGRELCQLVSFRDGTWAVADPDGRYDGSNGGDVEGLHWVVGDKPISPGELRKRFYDPGLLAKHMEFSREPLLAVTAPKPSPEATIEDDVAFPEDAVPDEAPPVTLTMTLGHVGPVASAAFSPDDRFVVTGGSDGVARLWETQTGREIRRFAADSLVAFAPSGRWMLTAGRGVQLWDVETGREWQSFYTPDVSAMNLSADGRYVAIGHNHGAATLWDLRTSVRVALLAGHTKGVNAVRFSPDGRHVLTGSKDGTAHLWDVATESIRTTLRHGGIVYSVGFSPDGSRLVTGGGDRTVRIWNAGTGEQLQQFDLDKCGHAVAFSPDGKSVLTGSCDGTARLWSTASASEVLRFPAQPTAAWRSAAKLTLMATVRDVRWSADGSLVLTASDEGSARLWDPNTGRMVRCLTASAEAIESLVLSADPTRLAAVGMGGAACIWNLRTGQPENPFEGQEGDVAALAFAPDGTSVLLGHRGGGLDLWSTSTGQRARTLVEGGTSVASVASSGDGRFVLLGDAEGTVRVLDQESGRESARFLGHVGSVTDVAFASRGTRVVTGGRDGTLRVWDASSYRELWRHSRSAAVRPASLSPDGRWALAPAEGANEVWDMVGGRRVGEQLFESEADPVALSPDGHWAAVALSPDRASIYDVTTGTIVCETASCKGTILAVAIAPDGGTILTGDAVPPMAPAPVLKEGEEVAPPPREGPTARLWDAKTGVEILRFVGHDSDVRAVAFSPDGASIVTGSLDGTARLWDRKRGTEIRRFGPHPGPVRDAVLTPSGKAVLTASPGKVTLWNAENGAVIRRFGQADQILNFRCVACSPEGHEVLAGTDGGTVHLWDVETGLERMRFVGHQGPVVAVAFRPDAHAVVTIGLDGTIREWEPSGREVVRRVQRRRDSCAFAVHPSDPWLVVADGNVARLLDLETGREINLFRHNDSVTSVAFSHDGREALTCCRDGTARSWNPATATEIRRFGIVPDSGVDGAPREGDAPLEVAPEADVRLGAIRAGAYSAADRWIFTGSANGTCRIWDAKSGGEVCTFARFRDGSWAVVDAFGRYDASNGGDVEGLYWVIGKESIDLAQLKERYYDPGLLAKHVGFSNEALREVKAFTTPKLYPEATLGEKDGKLVVHLKNRGGGIGRIVVKVNGVERTADARDPGADPDATEATLVLDLTGDPRLKPGEPNGIEVFAFNAEDYISSRGLKREWTPSGEVSRRAPELWAVVAGVSDYRGDAIDLRYAAKDASDFAAALALAGERLFGKERLHLARPEAPTRTVLVGALEAARAAKPEDVLVVYLAGHGVNFGGPEGDYHFLCADAASADLKDPAVREAVALSSSDLTALLNAIPALKRVLILDTCASGRLVEKLSEARDIPSSQIRAMDRLKDRTGFFVIAGCASDRVSYEASQYGQGLLTYSLLLGMRGAALREEEFVDVSTLFGFARDRVPKLATGIGGVQSPVLAAPKGGESFDVGRLTAEDKARVPLQAVRPMVLRTIFQEEQRPRDTLGLGKLVDERLREASSRPRDAPLVFIDAAEFPNAYEIGGRYRVEGGKVTVEATLFRGEEEAGRFVVEGSEGELAALAARIVAEAGRHLK